VKAGPDTRSLRSLLRDDSRAFILLALVFLGALYPLTDPDLPMHLLVGEWIVKHHAVPTVEPFAWTRAGEPYYAYSWLPQMALYLLWRAFGVFGLRVAHGLLMAGAAAAMMRLARTAAWPRGVSMVMVAAHVAAFGIAVPSLRPQAVLFIAMPLVWSAVHRLVSEPSCRRSHVILVISGALAAGSHIFFPMTAVPLIWLWVMRSPVRVRVTAAAAIVGGWLLSPYALLWPRVFALNFVPNALLGPGTPIAELAPGFSFRAGPTIETAFVTVVSAALILSATRLPLTGRGRIAAVLLWAVGVASFACATRLIVIFWLLVAPVAGHFLALWLTRPDRLAAIRAAGGIALAFLLASIIHPRHLGAWTAEGIASESLAWPEDSRVEGVVELWRCLPEKPRTARVFTRLEQGGMLAWRLRPHSMSIDSRTLFPDSVATAELGGAPPSGPWRTADAAILDSDDPVSAVLDTATGWMLVGERRSITEPLVLWLNSGRFDYVSNGRCD